MRRMKDARIGGELPPFLSCSDPHVSALIRGWFLFA